MDLDNFKANIRLVDSSVEKFSIDNLIPPIFQNQEEKQANMTIDYSVSEWSVEQGMMTGTVKLTIDTELSNKDGICTKCNLAYQGLFDAEENSITKEVFRQMLELNGVMILYQLSRSLITSITAQAGINPPITLPLVNIHNIVRNKNEEIGQEGEEE